MRYFAIAGGLILVIADAIAYVYWIRILRRSQYVGGKIVGFVERDCDGIGYHYVIEYHSHDGALKTFESHLGDIRMLRGKIGEEVIVRIDRNTPKHHDTGTSMLAFMPIGFVGGVMIYAGLVGDINGSLPWSSLQEFFASLGL